MRAERAGWKAGEVRGLDGPVEEPTNVERPFYARLRAMGIEVTPASPDARLPQVADVPGADLSGAVVEEREEQLRRWD